MYDFTQVDNIRCFELNSPETKKNEEMEENLNNHSSIAVSDQNRSVDDFEPADINKPHIKPSDLEDIAIIFDRIRLLYKNKGEIV